MARLCPSLPPRSALGAGEHAELDLLETLERGLPPAYLLFHSVDWTQAGAAQSQHGEVDIVVLNQAGDVLLLEVKAGSVDVRDGGLYKTYAGRIKDVLVQARRQHGAILARLKQAQLQVHVDHLLVLPDVQVLSDSVQWPRERIVDSGDMAQVVSRVMAALSPGLAQGDSLARVRAFFENRFQVEPDVSALAGRLQTATARMAAGLATWVPRISAPNGVIRVLGTAGSGKTQLALKLLRDADPAEGTGQKAAYLCFNRALADHMARVVPVRVPAETFHEFARNLASRSSLTPDLGQGASFQTLAEHCAATLAATEPDLDLLVLDEVQDMQPEWVEALLQRLKPGGRAVLLEDPAQQLYPDRLPFDVEGAVIVRSNENFRSPRALVALINGLKLAGDDILPLSPHRGDLPDPITHEQPEGVVRATVKAVQRCLDRGFSLADIAIVSLMGRERSLLQGRDRLGIWPLRRFTGRFDEGGGAIWTAGDLLIDSVRRFKGQAAAAVVLTECDLTDFDGLNGRLLFVGLTRARLHLEWVMSTATAEVLARRLQA
jgi:predicted RecB family endonuclease